MPSKVFSFSPGFSPVKGPSRYLFILTGLQPGERAITIIRDRFNGFVEGKQIKPLKRFSVHTFPLGTGLKPGENEMTFEAKSGDEVLGHTGIVGEHRSADRRAVEPEFSRNDFGSFEAGLKGPPFYFLDDRIED